MVGMKSIEKHFEDNTGEWSIRAKTSFSAFWLHKYMVIQLKRIKLEIVYLLSGAKLIEHTFYTQVA